MIRRAVIALAFFVALGTSVPAASGNVNRTFTCVPLEVTVLSLEARMLCAEPIPVYRGGYPLDNGYAVRYFSVPLANSEWSSRFIEVGDIAMAAGTPIRFSYVSGDYHGESFGCRRTDCRVPYVFTLVKTAWTP